MKDNETRQKAETWLKTSITIRSPRSKAAFCRKIGISAPTLKTWEEEFMKRGKLKPENGGSIDTNGDGYDSIGYLLGQLQAADIALLKSCVSGNAAAQKVLRTLLGQLKDTPEQEHGEISAEEHIRIREEAKRRVSEACGGTDGDRSLLPEHALLPVETREDTGQS